jgi:hypothetical protein
LNKDKNLSDLESRYNQDIRDELFLFFLPAPAGPFAGSCGAGAVCGTFGVGTLDEGGAGVVDMRCCWGAGASDEGIFSAPGAEGGGLFICAAVVRMAFRRSILFCCRLGASDGVGAVVGRFEETEDVSSSSAMEMSSSGFRLLVPSSCMEESVIGHTKPVRGV